MIHKISEILHADKHANVSLICSHTDLKNKTSQLECEHGLWFFTVQHKNTTILFTEVDTQGRYGVVKNTYIYKTDKFEKKIIESEKEGGK